MKNNKMTLIKAMKINHRAIKIYYKKYPQMIISKVCQIVFTSLTPYVGIYLSALIIEELSGDKNPDALRNLVLVSLISAAVIALVSAFLNKWVNTQNAGMYYKCEQIFSEKLLDMDFASVDDPKTYELLSEIRQSMNGGGWGLYRVLGNYESLLSSLFSGLGGIALTISLFTSKVPTNGGKFTILDNPLVVIAVIALMIAVIFVSPILFTKAGSYWAKNQDAHNFGNRAFGHFGFLGFNREIATDMRIYRQDLFCDKYIADKSETFHSKGIFAKYAKGGMGFFEAAGSAVSVVFTGIVYLFVCLKAWAGAFGVGMVTQYIASISRVAGGISNFVANVGDMKNNAFFLEQVFVFLDIPHSMYKGSLTVEKRRDRDYEIEFKDVSFKYPGAETYALSHVNMKFKVGSRLAVVGRNGSGKTTFIKLLCRLYDPTEGEILLNGINIQKYNYLDYMTVFSVVFQDFKLFSLLLSENVAAGTDFDREKVADCLKKAGFDERLSELENGIDTYIGKDYDESGINLSGGEMQKVAIARTLYKDAPFIILDEPTAALDPVAEAEIYSKFNEIVGDKTAIYISHRLSSCKFCDEIAVFENGAVVQKGKHSELVSDIGGKYYELWNAQAQYYKDSAAELFV